MRVTDTFSTLSFLTPLGEAFRAAVNDAVEVLKPRTACVLAHRAARGTGRLNALAL